MFSCFALYIGSGTDYQKFDRLSDVWDAELSVDIINHTLMYGMRNTENGTQEKVKQQQSVPHDLEDTA